MEATHTSRQHHWPPSKIQQQLKSLKPDDGAVHYLYTCIQMDHSPVRSVDTHECTTGYSSVAPMPTMALKPLAKLMTYAGMPFQSRVAVISVPKLQIFSNTYSISLLFALIRQNLSS
jgi:hypothetical protein